MLEAVMASVARADGIILCPEGFHKSVRQHIEKLGLSIRLIPAPPERDGKIGPWGTCAGRFRPTASSCAPCC